MKVQFKDIPSDIIDFTKICILDTLGAIIAGAVGEMLGSSGKDIIASC
ncbi:MAG: hypothetical protein QXW55_04370 [Candidatus Bathyarchaeia archaeon]|nr:hypothetical protein [Candidatus Bathyarchaeota archaeon]